MVIISSIGNLASVTNTPVINLVIDAIGSTACSFFLNKTSLVSWSMTKATLDFKSKESCEECRPAVLPKEGRTGTAANFIFARLPAGFFAAIFTGALLIRCFFAFAFWCVTAACAPGPAERTKLKMTNKFARIFFIEIQSSGLDLAESPYHLH